MTKSPTIRGRNVMFVVDNLYAAESDTPSVTNRLAELDQRSAQLELRLAEAREKVRHQRSARRSRRGR